jgi:Mg-chelatase subunit ChlD
VWVQQGQAPLHVMLIVDASASTFHFIEPVAKMLSVLYRDVYRSRDRMGLVAIQEGVPRVIHHPSRNLRRVLGHLTRLKPSGHTPLAEALNLALMTFRQAKRRQSDMNPLAVLLSDCHPEPVDATLGNLMMSPPYLAAMHAARLFHQARIPIVVINPAHGTFKDGRRWWGTELAMHLAALSAGRYYGIPTGRYAKDAGMVQQFFERRELQADTQAISELLQNFRHRSPDLSARPGRFE